jgi:hypothetical protein
VLEGRKSKICSSLQCTVVVLLTVDTTQVSEGPSSDLNKIYCLYNSAKGPKQKARASLNPFEIQGQVPERDDLPTLKWTQLQDKVLCRNMLFGIILIKNSSFYTVTSLFERSLSPSSEVVARHLPQMYLSMGPLSWLVLLIHVSGYAFYDLFQDVKIWQKKIIL